MKKRMVMIAAAVILVAMVTACGSSGDKNATGSNDSGSAAQMQTIDTQNTTQNKVSADESKLLALTGTPLTEAMDQISELGYSASYYADGVDFTDFIDDFKEDYTTGEMKINESEKTVEINLILTSNIEVAEAEKALSEKLNLGTAWNIAEKYGKQEYGKSFDLNYLTGKIDASANDENTWFLKAECSIDGTKKTCEAKVTGTTSNAEVISFDVY